MGRGSNADEHDLLLFSSGDCLQFLSEKRGPKNWLFRFWNFWLTELPRSSGGKWHAESGRNALADRKLGKLLEAALLTCMLEFIGLAVPVVRLLRPGDVLPKISGCHLKQLNFPLKFLKVLSPSKIFSRRKGKAKIASDTTSEGWASHRLFLSLLWDMTFWGTLWGLDCSDYGKSKRICSESGEYHDQYQPGLLPFWSKRWRDKKTLPLLCR